MAAWDWARFERVRASRTTVGRAMVAIGLTGILVSLIAVWVGQSVLGQVEHSIDDSLELTGEAIGAAVDSIEVTSSIVTTVQSGVRGVAATLTTVQQTISDSTGALDASTAFIAGPLPKALSSVNAVLPTIESVANSIDDALRFASRAPFGPNYDPEQPFDQAIRGLRSALRPLPGELRTLSGQFAGLTRSSAQLTSQLSTLRTNLTQLDGQLTQVSQLVERYRTTATEAKDLAERSRSNLRSDTAITRLLLVMLGLVFASSQIVPIWLGAMLLRDEHSMAILHRTGADNPPPRRSTSLMLR